MMANEKILVVEDEEDLLELLRYNLERERYRVMCATSGETALRKVQEEPPDLILLDLMLPGVDGLDVCRELQKQASTSRIPLIIVTAKSEDSDVVSGLELGADDYITKPFSPRILLARMKAVLRGRQRQDTGIADVLKVHDLTIDTGRYEVMARGASVPLTATEFAILHLLARRPGWVYSRDQIIRSVKGDDYPVTDRSVDVQIVGLRRKLGRAGDCIETVRGVGYRLKENL
jgi:two-component system, OmpR family, alkaline phosphatase synthesis response regulator PhoP